VGVPAVVAAGLGAGELDEADAALDQSAGNEALVGVIAGLVAGGVEAVEGLGDGGFAEVVPES
jgi:hypothetical protein